MHGDKVQGLEEAVDLLTKKRHSQTNIADTSKSLQKQVYFYSDINPRHNPKFAHFHGNFISFERVKPLFPSH